jgi:hypothetical protein
VGEKLGGLETRKEDLDYWTQYENSKKELWCNLEKKKYRLFITWKFEKMTLSGIYKQALLLDTES